MRNEELLDELEKLFNSFNLEAIERDKEFEYWKGVVEEMRRHNGRTIKILAGIITTLLTLMGVMLYFLQQLIGKLP